MRTLVLNRNWMPVSQIDWRRGFTLVFRQKAEALEFYEHVVKSTTEEFFVPAVIRLYDYGKVPRRKVHYSKRVVFERDGWKCQYCSKALCPKTATIDHILPRSAGGKTTFDNTVASCFKCNNKKGHRLLNQTNFRLPQKPSAPSQVHFNLRLGMLAQEWLPYIPEAQHDRKIQQLA